MRKARRAPKAKTCHSRNLHPSSHDCHGFVHNFTPRTPIRSQLRPEVSLRFLFVVLPHLADLLRDFLPDARTYSPPAVPQWVPASTLRAAKVWWPAPLKKGPEMQDLLDHPRVLHPSHMSSKGCKINCLRPPARHTEDRATHATSPHARTSPQEGDGGHRSGTGAHLPRRSETPSPVLDTSVLSFRAAYRRPRDGGALSCMCKCGRANGCDVLGVSQLTAFPARVTSGGRDRDASGQEAASLPT